MRPIWKGAVSFGLVNIPVKIFAATEQKRIKFRLLHKECSAPLRYSRICTNCGKEVEAEDIVKGYEFEAGRFVIIDEEELSGIAMEPGKSIDIIDFVSLREIDPVYFDTTYYLAPGETGSKAYLLLQKAMAETEKIAVARFFLRSRESLAAIRVFDNLLALETIYYPDEIRSPAALPGLEKEIELHANELTMARELVENLATSFDPEKYDDKYRKNLQDLIRKKIEGKEIIAPKVAEKGQIVDLEEALRASVALAKKAQNQKGRKAAGG